MRIPTVLCAHSALPRPTTPVACERVLDQEPWEPADDSPPEVHYDPEAILALIYTSGTTGRPKGVMVSHANVLADVHTSTTGWIQGRRSVSSRRAYFSHRRFPRCSRPLPSALVSNDAENSARKFLRNGRARARHAHGPGATMINCSRNSQTSESLT